MANYTNVSIIDFTRVPQPTATILFFLWVTLEKIPSSCHVLFHGRCIWVLQHIVRWFIGSYIFYRFSISPDISPSHVVGYICYTFFYLYFPPYFGFRVFTRFVWTSLTKSEHRTISILICSQLRAISMVLSSFNLKKTLDVLSVLKSN